MKNTGKRLQLLRHAKSSWDHPDLKDFQRPLNDRGKRDSFFMAKKLVEGGADFSHTFSSTAKRARHTIRNISKALETGIQWHEVKKLYTFDASDIMHWLSQLDEEIETVMLVGHNPALLDLSFWLSKEELENIPTCAYLSMSLDIPSWREINGACGRIDKFLYPKMYKKGSTLH